MFGLTYLIIVVIIDVIAINDVLQRKKDQEKRILWIVVIVLAPVLGPILYYLIGRK